MTTHITMRAAQARCYECGAPEVLQVCHHCGQAICRAHRRLPFELQRWLLHSEFDGLGLPETLARIAPAHCRDCDHVVYAPRVLVLAIGAALAITGAALLARRFSFAALVLLGLGLALAAAYALNWRWRANPRNRPPLPLFPRIGVIKIRETVAATVTLDERGDYHIAQQPATGELEVVASLQASERERLAHYRKWLHLPPNQSVAFHAGFLALRGKAALQLTGANRADLVAPNIIALMGETGALPLLNSASARASDTFPCKYTYQVYDPPKPMPLPINLVPSFIPEAGAQALDLELQWINPRQWSDPLAIERIALLRVDVPVAWGTVKSIEGGDALLCSLDNGFQRIEWSLPPIAEDQAQRKSWRFSLRFSNKIEPEDMLCGRAEVQFKGTLSSVDGVDLFFPTGAKRAEITNKVGTTVAVDFTLSLARVRYQDTRVVPDPKLPQDHTFQASSIYEGVVPDYATVIALTKALSAGDIYIKRLVENPPRIGERVSQRNRYWDITGRFYTVVYPIDIHIVLSGEEVHNGEIRAQGGTSYIDLTVQGTYVNSAMEAQIVQLWENLRALIDDTMRMLPRTRSAIQASLEDEVAPPLGVSAWPAPDEALFHPALVGTEGWANSGVSGVERARERLDKLIQSINTAALPPAQVSEELMLIAHDLDRDSGAPRGLRQAEVGGLQ